MTPTLTSIAHLPSEQVNPFECECGVVTPLLSGILQILTHNLDIVDTAAVICVMQVTLILSVKSIRFVTPLPSLKVKGDVNAVFDELDTDNSGTIEANELAVLLNKLSGIHTLFHSPHIPSPLSLPLRS